MQLLQYNLTHPYPRSKLFTTITLVLVTLVLPVLVIVNIATVGQELFPSEEISAKRHGFSVVGNHSSVTTLPATKLKSEDEGRIEYRGGSFGACFVYDIRFDLSFIESTQSLTTRVVFATEHSKDVIGQFYGYDVHLIDFVDEDSRDYRRVVFDVLDVISTDSLSILDGAITQWLSLSARASVSNELNFISTDMHAVELDLGNPSSENIFTNSSAVNSTFSPNLPPTGIAPRDWVGRNSFRHDRVEEPYFTFAQMLRAGVPANITTALGNLTGLQETRQWTATMFLSAWTAWMSVTAMLAKRIAGPCVTCTCGTHLDPEGQPTRCDHSHAIVVSGLTTGW
ncbi:hypothetical protein RHS01_03730 [Rhizoctonia solani]|uniref:Transmembrane protein n=1 Tax=Rhizoctonia solani TaxID=456999 RepID=A0A8H7IDS4_9AGAM|nr:hypothetical protein RHS01_03730 [Rhizoctonia solani]